MIYTIRIKIYYVGSAENHKDLEPLNILKLETSSILLMIAVYDDLQMVIFYPIFYRYPNTSRSSIIAYSLSHHRYASIDTETLKLILSVPTSSQHHDHTSKLGGH